MQRLTISWATIGPVLFTTLAILAISHLKQPPVQAVFAISLVLLVATRKTATPHPLKIRPALVVFTLISAAFFTLTCVTVIFGKTTLAAFMYHLKLGTAGYGYGYAMSIAPLFVAVWLFMMAAVVRMLKHNPAGKNLLWGISLVYLLASPLAPYARDYIRFQLGANAATPMPDLAQIYTPPEPENRPAPAKNLIIIYLEGLERTYGQSSVFADAYKPLADLEKQAVVFTNIAQLSNTGWTIAGMSASQCGVPLVTPGLWAPATLRGGDSFLPDATCLGDLLSALGYSQTFLLGSKPAFARKDLFYKTHGFDSIIGKEDLTQVAPDDRNGWGLYDDDLFAVTKARLARLESRKTPYNMVLLTVGPHGYTPFVAGSCTEEGRGFVSENILDAVACTGRLTRDFIRDIRDIVDMDNTLIVVMSDHLTHENNMTPVLEGMERRNTVMMLGAGLAARRIDKAGAMIDVYPTILQALGYDLPEDRAGLGVSLFSDRPTLVEQYGVDTLDTAIMYDDRLARRLWGE